MKTIKITAVLLFLSSAAFFLNAKDAGDISKTFKVTKGGTLKISMMTGDITIKTWDKNEVSVKINGADDNEADNIKIVQSGNTVTIDYRDSGGWGSSFDVDATVPYEFNADIETNQGDVNLDNDLKGSLKVYTGGGDIDIKNVAGKTTLKTNGGDISTGNIGGDLDLSTNGGDVHTGNISGKTNIRTMGGSISTGNTNSEITAKTFGGDINIGSVGGNVEATTMGGSIHLKKVSGSAVLKTNGGNLTLDGANGSVMAKTLGGNINLYNISGYVNASTSAGDVFVELHPSGSGSSRITTMSGSIKLTLPASAKANIEASVKLHGRSGYYNKDNKAIASDFPSTTYNLGGGDYSNNITATYVLNGGGEKISLKTMNGTISIKKLSK